MTMAQSHGGNACFLCLGGRSTTLNPLTKSCSTCHGAYVHRRCWKRWFQQQRIHLVRRPINDRTPFSWDSDIPREYKLCPVCRTGEVESTISADEAFATKFTELEEMQTRIYSVVTIAMDYYNSLRLRDSMESEFASLDDYIYWSMTLPKHWIVFAVLFVTSFILYVYLVLLGGGNPANGSPFPSLTFLFATYALTIFWFGSWFAFVRNEAVKPIVDTFTSVEEGRKQDSSPRPTHLKENATVRVPSLWLLLTSSGHFGRLDQDSTSSRASNTQYPPQGSDVTVLRGPGDNAPGPPRINLGGGRLTVQDMLETLRQRSPVGIPGDS